MNALKPFTPNPENIEVNASFRNTHNAITLDFLLRDPSHATLDSLSSGEWKTWARADELWKTTCFEAFFGMRGQPSYWEINFSPASQKWNLYSFDQYRTPQPPRPSFDLELVAVSATTNSLKCSLTSKIKLVNLEVSLCAVIRTKSGPNYYALKHASTKPDFHLRESFV